MMTRIFKIFSYGLSGCLLFFFINSFFEPLYTPTAIPVKRKLFHFPKIIAHKGIISGKYKGNTLRAIDEVLA
jgi:hypothetical protein